ncbi:MAG: hypothetical protein L6414_05845, partial [Hydrogenophaga sp.]|nr:hypothetical protein [Hydrogenophaga sp.]
PPASPTRPADAAGHTGRRRSEPIPAVTPGATGGGIIAGAARGAVGATGPAGSCGAQCAPNTPDSPSAGRLPDNPP